MPIRIFTIPPPDHVATILTAMANRTPLGESQYKLFAVAANEISPRYATDKHVGPAIWQAMAKLGMHKFALKAEELAELNSIVQGSERRGHFAVARRAAQRSKRLKLNKLEIMCDAHANCPKELIAEINLAVDVICLAWCISDPGNPETNRACVYFLAASQISEPDRAHPKIEEGLMECMARLGLLRQDLMKHQIKSLRSLLITVSKDTFLMASKTAAEEALKGIKLEGLKPFGPFQADLDLMNQIERAVGVLCLAWQIVNRPGEMQLSTKRPIARNPDETFVG